MIESSNTFMIEMDGNKMQVIEFVSFLTLFPARAVCFLFQLKLSFTLDKDTMMPQGCYVYQYRDSNK